MKIKTVYLLFYSRQLPFNGLTVSLVDSYRAIIENAVHLD